VELISGTLANKTNVSNEAVGREIKKAMHQFHLPARLKIK
jgi:hypothetical protein